MYAKHSGNTKGRTLTEVGPQPIEYIIKSRLLLKSAHGSHNDRQIKQTSLFNLNNWHKELDKLVFASVSST